MFLIVGKNGQVASELRAALGGRAVAVGSAELDVGDADAVRAFFRGKRFDAVVNCAAYTAVDKAEDEPELAARVNADGPRHLADALAETGTPLVHLSTDYVFDGRSCRPYTEADAPAPTSVYGATKLAGERAVLERAATALVVRTSWVYSAHGSNFVKTMRRLGAERARLGVVFDQIGTPTCAADLARAVAEILPRIEAGTRRVRHFSDEGACSWYDFARAVMELSGLTCEVEPILTRDYPTRATRPFYSVLDKSAIKRDFGVAIPHWRDSLARFLANLPSARPNQP
ncbi:MAG: dTDP-4-dehydrorhamnose reductase [Candidatus Spyradosoma sp.]